MQRRPTLSRTLLLAVAVITLMTLSKQIESFSALPKTPNKVSAILFDIDGTLVHSDPIHFQVFQELLLKEPGFNDNQPIDESFFRDWIAGRANSLIMQDLFPDWSMAKREDWSSNKEARFRQVAKATMKQSQLPGLDRLQAFVDSQRWHKAAVTNAPRPNAEAILRGIGYHDWFTHVVIGDECERPKPDPCPYLTACQLLNVSPESCLVMEDSPSGAQAGVAAGAYVIGIVSGQSEATLLKAGCRLIIQDFEDPKLWLMLDKLSTKSEPVTGASR